MLGVHVCYFIVNSRNEFQVFRQLFPASHLRKRRVVLHEGDHVRISRKKHMFEKEHAAMWTEEIFKIIRLRKL